MINFKEWTGCDIEVHIKGSGRGVKARCYYLGSSYHCNNKPFINIRIPKYIQYPYQMYVYKKTAPEPPILKNQDELIIYILGHEIMHYWEYLNKMKQSEVYCEISADTFLNFYRSSQLLTR